MRLQLRMLAAFVLALASEVSADSGATRADFALRRETHASRLRIQMASVLPGDTLELVAQSFAGAPLPIDVRGSPDIERIDGERARFRAGWMAGFHALRIRSPAAREEILLHVFVETPSSALRGTRLGGYEIGHYPTGDPKRPPPRGFIAVTEANADTRVSPHFRLRDFLCKQESGWPKYVVLDPRLPAKLEALLERAQSSGMRAETFTVMSGYRTPAYHRAIGNTTAFSSHLWGSAVDVFIDADRDGTTDDLDGDGSVDARDAKKLLALVDALDRAPTEDWTVGGAGAYPATSAHGPFIHVDVRGRAARW